MTMTATEPARAKAMKGTAQAPGVDFENIDIDEIIEFLTGEGYGVCEPDEEFCCPKCEDIDLQAVIDRCLALLKTGETKELRWALEDLREQISYSKPRHWPRILDDLEKERGAA